MRTHAARAIFALLGVWFAGPATPAQADRVEHFIGRLKHDSYKVRFQATYFLGRLKDARAIPSLVMVMADSEESVRAGAAIALARLGGPLAGAALMQAVHDRSAWVRAEAIKGVGVLEVREAWTALVAALTDSDARVRLEAVTALSRLGEKGGVLPLAGIVIASRTGGFLAQAARRALRTLASTMALEELAFLLRGSPGSAERAKAAVILSELKGGESARVLRKSLSDPNPRVRALGIIALARADPKAALGILKRMAAIETIPAVKKLLRRTLADLGTPGRKTPQ